MRKTLFLLSLFWEMRHEEDSILDALSGIEVFLSRPFRAHRSIDTFHPGLSAWAMFCRPFRPKLCAHRLQNFRPKLCGGDESLTSLERRMTMVEGRVLFPRTESLAT